MLSLLVIALHDVSLLISLSGRSQHVVSTWCTNDGRANVIDTVNHQCELNYLSAFRLCEKREREGEGERGGLAYNIAALPKGKQQQQQSLHIPGAPRNEAI